MAWESRKGRGRYYTRSKRVNGRVVRQYLGCGPAAMITAQVDEWVRRRKAAQRQALKAEQARWQERAALLRTLDEVCERVMRDALEEAGYHRHKRQWRKKRGEKSGPT